MSDTTLLDVAFGHGKTKAIAYGTGCSLRQAKRMLQRGKIPAALREAVLRLAHKNLATKLVEIEAAINDVHRYEIELASLQAAAGMAAADGEALALRHYEDDRPEVAALTSSADPPI